MNIKFGAPTPSCSVKKQVNVQHYWNNFAGCIGLYNFSLHSDRVASRQTALKNTTLSTSDSRHNGTQNHKARFWAVYAKCRVVFPSVVIPNVVMLNAVKTYVVMLIVVVPGLIVSPQILYGFRVNKCFCVKTNKSGEIKRNQQSSQNLILGLMLWAILLMAPEIQANDFHSIMHWVATTALLSTAVKATWIKIYSGYNATE